MCYLLFKFIDNMTIALFHASMHYNGGTITNILLVSDNCVDLIVSTLYTAICIFLVLQCAMDVSFDAQLRLITNKSGKRLGLVKIW